MLDNKDLMSATKPLIAQVTERAGLLTAVITSK